MDRKAAFIVSAIEHATRHMRIDATHHVAPPLDPKKPWGPHCSHLFRETMRQLASAGVSVPDPYVDEDADANTLGQRIRQYKKDWTKLETSLTEAQTLANEGALVVGSYINKPGHLGFIYPIDVQGRKPVVRDGNVHKDERTGEIWAASTYGAVPASRAFPLSKTQWFKYRHY